jgi:hypothetical protein
MMVFPSLLYNTPLGKDKDNQKRIILTLTLQLLIGANNDDFLGKQVSKYGQ